MAQLPYFSFNLLYHVRRIHSNAQMLENRRILNLESCKQRSIAKTKKSRKVYKAENEHNKTGLSITKQAGKRRIASRNEIVGRFSSARYPAAHRMPQGILSRGHSRYAETCFAQQSCRRNTACHRCVSYRGTGRPVRPAGAFLRYVQTIWYRVFRRVRRTALGCWSTFCARACRIGLRPGSTPANPTMELRRGKRRTSPISAISCAEVVSPTPYMAQHSIILRQLLCKARHLGTQSGQCHLAGKQLLCRCGNE